MNNNDDTNQNQTQTAVKVVGQGAFGVVYEVKASDSEEVFAIKKVLQDKRFKNRELQILKDLNHSNIISLRHAFQTSGNKPEELQLNLVMDQIPDNLIKVMKEYSKRKETIPLILIKLYAFQMVKAMNQIHIKSICHRDIKPQNFLIDPQTHMVKLCDFGSAKILQKNEANVSQISARFQRAPELIFGCTDYWLAIDTWSLGCVLAEMILGHPLFPGESSVDQFVEIVKVLGNPSKEDVKLWNPNQEQKFPDIKPISFKRVFREDTPKEAIDLVHQMIRQNQNERISNMDILAHPFFQEIKEQGVKLPDNKEIDPKIFNFTNDEISEQKYRQKIVPDHINIQQ